MTNESFAQPKVVNPIGAYAKRLALFCCGVAAFFLATSVEAQNYSFRSSSGATIPAGGALVAGTTADDAVVSLTAPFAFRLYQTDYAAGQPMRVSTNGNIRLSTATTANDFNNIGPLPSAGAGGAIPDDITLFPYWDDLFPQVGTGGGVYQNVVGTAPSRQWVIEWRAAVGSATSPNVRFAVVFFEDQSAFEYRYVQTGDGTAANGAGATVGVQAGNLAGRFATTFSNNTASITPGLVLRAVFPKNYAFVQDTNPVGVLIPNGGTLVPGSRSSNQWLGFIQAPFPLLLYEETRPGITLSTNGWAGSDDRAGLTSEPNNGTLPSALVSRTDVAGGTIALMPYWDSLGDLNECSSLSPLTPIGGCGIYTHVIGVAPNRQWIVEWRYPHPTVSSGTALRFAIVFVEGINGFRYHYQRTPETDSPSPGANVDGAGATIGVQRGGRSSDPSTTFSVNRASVTSRMTLRARMPVLAQNIAFTPVAAKSVGDPPFTVTAISDRGLPVALSASPASVCTVSGTTVTIVATAGGTCTLSAASAASTLPVSDPDAFNAGFATLDIPVRGPQNLVFNPPDRIFGSDLGTQILLASTSPAEPAVGTSYSSSTLSVCSVTIVPTVGAPQGVSYQLNLLQPGTCTITASNAGNTTFAPATATRSFAITRATLSFTPPANISLNAGALSISATSQLTVITPITFATTSAGICSVSASGTNAATVTPIALGNCVVTASQLTSPSNIAPLPVTQTIAIVAQTQTITFGQPANQTLPTLTLALTATASSGLPVTLSSLTPTVCTVSGSAATLVAPGICTIRATQAGNGTFATATPVDRSFSVLPPVPTCDLNNPQLDCDNDSMPNGVERELGTNPSAKDNDIFANTDLGRRLFVRQIYRDVLGREGDAGGINFWFNEITAGRQTRTTMLESFLFAPESEATAVQAARLYFAAFQRSADPAGLTFWTNSVIANGPTVVAQAFATSGEFLQRYGSLDNAGFIDRMYRNVLGRPADAVGTSFWVGQMGAPSNLTRGQVLLQFANSPEYRALIDPSVSVSRLYISMLVREPDDAGLAFWAGTVRNGGSIRGLIDSFVSSAEYRSRFLPN